MADCYSTGASTSTKIIRENTSNVTPATPQMQLLPVAQNTLNLSQDVLQSQLVYGDKQRRYSIKGNKAVGGNLVGEMQAGGVTDMLLEGVMANRFSGASDTTLIVGDTPSSFTIERSDDAKNIHERFTGCTVNSITWDISLGSIIGYTVNMIGTDANDSTTSLDASPTEAPDVEPLTQANATFKIGGTTIDHLSNLSLTISQNATPNPAIGFDTAGCITSTLVTCTFTATFYLKDLSKKQLFTNGTQTSMEVVMAGGGESVTLKGGNVVWQSADLPQDGEGVRTITLDGECLFDEASGSIIEIIRSV